MAPRLFVLLPRLVVVCAVFVLATGTLTYAAQKKLAATPPAPTTEAPAAPIVKLVPDVQGQAYVFAKGILEDHGFAWRVEGAVQGFAANTVVEQVPAAGTRVVDTGSPTIVLRLADNPSYADDGTPENLSPYRGSAIRLADTPAAPVTAPKSAKPAAKQKPAAKPKPGAKAKPAAKPKPTAKPKPAAKPNRAAKPKPATKPKAVAQSRPPAFVVAGAPKEPVDELSLPARARKLSAWLATHPRPTDRAVHHWLVQHAWVVTGAKFGWWRGKEALRILIAADRRAQKAWGVGERSERIARAALAQVEAASP